MVLVFAGIVTVFIDDLRPVESVHVIRGEIDSFRSGTYSTRTESRS